MRTLFVAAFAVLAIAPGGLAQAPADPYAYILAGAPVAQREGAGVLKWKPDFTYETLKKSTNQIVCYDQSGWPLQQAFSIECTHEGNLARVAQNYRFEASGDRAKRNALVNEAEKNGTRVKPVYGSIWHHLYGPDKDHVLHHMTIATPGATGAMLGLPESGAANGGWVMDAGTSSSHIMLPPQE
ncbi:MAG: hypothetical protein AB7H96_23440 [Vicinamibacterales bacterium]